MIKIEMLPVNPETLSEYSKIPMRYTVESVLSLELEKDGMEGIILREEKVEEPYLRDFDILDGEGPIRWTKTFDTGNWIMWIAYEDKVPIGGATVVSRTPEVHMLAGREDISVLWDIRVNPQHKRRGVGTGLFKAASKWSKEQGFKYMKIESQNINVPACRFYTRQGCKLGEINRFAYTGPQTSHETMLVWYLDLSALQN